MIQHSNFAPGDTVKVYQKITESDKGETKTRIQVFEGVVLGIRGRGENKSFTARKVVDGVVVERIWPLASLSIEKITVKSPSKKRVRRAKLYF